MGFVDDLSRYAPDADETARGWDFLGAAPTPVSRRLSEDVARTAASASGRPLRCGFPLGRGGRSPFDRLRFLRSPEEFPAMLASCDGGQAFNRRFHREHVETGAFASCQPRAAAEFSELIDPQGWIGVYAVAPFVMLIDRERLNGRPAPRRWSELLDPLYRGEVVFGGWRPQEAARFAVINTFFLVNMLRRFGLAGLKALLRNVPTLLHSAQMPRLAGTPASPGGVYVTPWFLADLCPRRATTEVVWPEDGALAYPLWLTVQTRRRDDLQPLIDLFYGAELGAYLSENLYPSLSPLAAPQIPRGGLSWLGWDYVRSRHAAADQKAARAAFAEVVPCG